MNEKKISEMIADLLNNEHRLNVQLPERDDILEYLNGLILVTGNVDIMYCNAFLKEALQLLTNSIFLYEKGFFDCAFYSVRQASELVNNMLYLSKNKNNIFEKWSGKEKFPMNSKIKIMLEKISCDYKEIKTLIPEYFEHFDELAKKSNKIIHKQGFDTFYNIRNHNDDKNFFSLENEINFFSEYLRYTIGVVLIMFIILEPISLALADEEITLKLNFDFFTESIDVNYFEKYLGLNDIVYRIKNSKFYRNFISEFNEKETMLPAVYSVIREGIWDLESLDQIEKQLSLLNIYERFMFFILKFGMQISVFYFCDGLIWYITSIKSNFSRNVYGSEEFGKYSKTNNRFNQNDKKIYMSTITMYDQSVFLEHNEKLTEEEIQILELLENYCIQELKEFDGAVSELK